MKYLLITIAFFSYLFAYGQEQKVISPNGKNIITLSTDTEGTLYYNIRSNGEEVVKSSIMGINSTNNQFCFKNELKYIDKIEQKIDETYKLPSGKRSLYTNKANETTFIYSNADNNKINITCRAYNDGVAFRYKLSNTEPIIIKQELTECRLSTGTTTWMMDWIKDYENFYPKRLLDTIASPEEFLFPVLTLKNEQWTLMTEAEVYNLPAMHLKKKKDTPIFQYVYAREDSSFIAMPFFQSSWKVFITSNKIGEVIESNLVENLNPPTKYKDLNWIKPGVATFPWWSNYLANSHIDILKKYVDLAAEMKWEWLEFDVSLINTPFHSSKEWEKVTWIPELTAYAHSKGIRVYGWDEIKILDNKIERDYVFDRYKSMGIDGIKIDYIDSDSQHAMMFRDTACAEAAKRQMMVSFHGETLPRGHRRYYPNIMTNEGVRGAEYYTFKGVKSPDSRHNCTLPFTRNIVGPMDYTPVTFTIRKENPRTTTYAHELALAFAFESGWICMADCPEAYLNSPARPLLEKIEAAWDDIHFIDGYPGEYFCVARCKNGKWFVAGINSETARTITIPLEFLPRGYHNITLYGDSKKDALHNIHIVELRNKTRNDTLRIPVLPHGGFVLDIN